MASVDLRPSVKIDWIFANPWFWLSFGGGLTLWSCLWTFRFGETASDYRVVALGGGLFFTAIGVLLRWNDRQTTYLLPRSLLLAGVARLAMGLILALLGLGTTVLFVLTIFFPERADWKPGATFLIWLSVAPLSFAAGWRCFKRQRDQADLNAVEEVGLSLVVAGLCCMVGSLTLDLGGAYAYDWDTLRMFLRVLLAVCLLGSALMLVSTGLRRMVLSLIITLHFVGIATATLAAPPASWLTVQVWTRVFRPYLEFLYLTNAYHFYAPEPGPSSYYWFRLIYEAPDGRTYGRWYKVPDVDDQSSPFRTAGLEYQRFLALTESSSSAEPPPPYTDARGQIASLYEQRILLQPGSRSERVVGIEPLDVLRIPLHPELSIQAQYTRPTQTFRTMLSSFSKFLGRKFAVHPEHPDWMFKSVKIYRVVHWIPQPAFLNIGLPPDDPTLYRPFFMGNYDGEGNRVEDDPYLYWLLPIMRADRNDTESKIWDFARMHAGDPKWVRPRLTKHEQHADPPAWGLPSAQDEKLVQP